MPLSLENNSTLTGTGVILDQFGEEFSIPTVSHVENLPFDSNSKSFCLKKARDHTEFMLMMSHHKKQMRQYDSQLSSAENHGAMVSNESEDDSSDEDDSDKDGESDEDEPDSGNVGIPRPETRCFVEKTRFLSVHLIQSKINFGILFSRIPWKYL